jgi:hydrogenase expression/formation protein HypE
MDEIIKLIHGEGGRATTRLVREIFLKRFGNKALEKLTDSACLDIDSRKIAFTTDAFVVDPPEFPGGDIGKLAVCGTVNDLCAAGAEPIFLSTSFIIEEGLKINLLKAYVESMAKAAEEALVEIVCGDTKVVPVGKADGIFISTSGIGRIICNTPPEPVLIKEGDAIVVSGTIAKHACAIIAVREGLKTNPILESDCAPLARMVKNAIIEIGEIHAMRDPTRGGLGGILVELAEQSGKKFFLDEKAIPIDGTVCNICELYGFDPLFMACEGRMVFILPKNKAHGLVENLRKDKYGKDASLIGRVENGNGVMIETSSGSRRRLIQPEGAPLPRIC